MLTRKCYRKPRDLIIWKIHFFDIIKIFEDGGLKFINIIVALFDFKFTLFYRPIRICGNGVNLKTNLRLIVFRFRPSKERPPRSRTLLKLKSRYSKANTFFNSHFESVKILLFDRSSFRRDAQSLNKSLLIELLWFFSHFIESRL